TTPMYPRSPATRTRIAPPSLAFTFDSAEMSSSRNLYDPRQPGPDTFGRGDLRWIFRSNTVSREPQTLCLGRRHRRVRHGGSAGLLCQASVDSPVTTDSLPLRTIRSKRALTVVKVAHPRTLHHRTNLRDQHPN